MLCFITTVLPLTFYLLKAENNDSFTPNVLCDDG